MLDEKKMRFVALGNWNVWSPKGKANLLFDFMWIYKAQRMHTSPLLFPHWKTSIIVKRQWSATGVLSQAEIGAAGPLTTSSELQLPSFTELIGINLHPESVPQILGVMNHEIKDTLIDLTDKKQFENTMALVEKERDPAFIARSLLTDILGIWGSSGTKLSNSVLHALRAIRVSRGTLKIDDITSNIGISARSLHRHFLGTIGLPPKHYSRSERLKSLILETDKCINPDWSSIAQDFGFSDQSHMTREVSSLMGVSPKKLHHIRKSDA
jgi:AraC-like DNA-binding protein